MENGKYPLETVGEAARTGINLIIGIGQFAIFHLQGGARAELTSDNPDLLSEEAFREYIYGEESAR